MNSNENAFEMKVVYGSNGKQEITSKIFIPECINTNEVNLKVEDFFDYMKITGNEVCVSGDLSDEIIKHIKEKYSYMKITKN